MPGSPSHSIKDERGSLQESQWASGSGPVKRSFPLPKKPNITLPPAAPSPYRPDSPNRFSSQGQGSHAYPNRASARAKSTSPNRRRHSISPPPTSRLPPPPTFNQASTQSSSRSASDQIDRRLDDRPSGDRVQFPFPARPARGRGRSRSDVGAPRPEIAPATRDPAVNSPALPANTPTGCSVDSDGDIVMGDINNPIVIDEIAEYVADERKKDPVAKEPVAYPTTRRNSPPSTSKDSQVSCVLVIDTCFIISHLHFVDDLVRAHSRWGNVVLMPWAVTMELDGLKISSKINTIRNGGSIRVSDLARRAIGWAFERMRNSNPALWGQTREEVIDKNATSGDDAILDCCRYMKEVRKFNTVLLSNDKNLCVKAMVYGMKTVSFVDSSVRPEALLSKFIDYDSRRPDSQSNDVSTAAFKNPELDRGTLKRSRQRSVSLDRGKQRRNVSPYYEIRTKRAKMSRRTRLQGRSPPRGRSHSPLHRRKRNDSLARGQNLQRGPSDHSRPGLEHKHAPQRHQDQEPRQGSSYDNPISLDTTPPRKNQKPDNQVPPPVDQTEDLDGDMDMRNAPVPTSEIPNLAKPNNIGLEDSIHGPGGSEQSSAPQSVATGAPAPTHDSLQTKKVKKWYRDLLQQFSRDITKHLPSLLRHRTIEAFDDEETVNYLKIPDVRKATTLAGIEAYVGAQWFTVFGDIFSRSTDDRHVEQLFKQGKLSRELILWNNWAQDNYPMEKPTPEKIDTWVGVWTRLWDPLAASAGTKEAKHAVIRHWMELASKIVNSTDSG